MKGRINQLAVIAIIACCQNIAAVDNMITLFIKQYPLVNELEQNHGTQTQSSILQQPQFTQGQPDTKKIKPGQGFEGIEVAYLGYISTTDHLGQVTFPRKQQKSTMNILVTPRIQPVYRIAPATIQHWQLKKSMPVEMYTVSLEHDKKTNLYYFETKKATLPKNNIIDLNTIIIFADPKEIYVPEGAVISRYTANLVLPNIYAKNPNITDDALYTLSIKEYFEQIHTLYKNDKQDIVTLVANH